MGSGNTGKNNPDAQAPQAAGPASIGGLASRLAHEINNPNSAIRFGSTLIARAWRDIMPILQAYYEENGDFTLGGLPFSQARSSFPQLLADISSNSDRIRHTLRNLSHMSGKDAGGVSERVDI